jgi:NADP-dependent 3-hydroxy acid dehydrogenase YdfG
MNEDSRPLDLAGRSALVTGASGAIGGAIADALAGAGMALLLSGRDRGRLEAAAERARDRGAASVQAWPADLAEDGAAEALAGRALGTLGGLDVLVHALGHFAAGTIAQGSLDDLDRQYRVNLRAPWALTRALLPALEERRGQVVFINSSAGLHPARGAWGAYAATKHALRALADSLRDEVNRQGVRVISIFPGRTASAMQERVKEYEGCPYHPDRLLQPADVAATVLGALALPRTAEVTDLSVRPMQAG